VGVATAATWLALVRPEEVRADAFHPAYLAPLPAILAVNLFVRFLRWHFLLRRVSVKIPTRTSLSIYLASLAAIATPAYLGEIVRPVLVRRRFGVPMSRTLPVLVAERALDAAALAMIAAATASNGVVLALVIGGAVLVAGVLWAVARAGTWLPATAAAIEQLTRRGVVVPAVLLSFAAWIPAGLLVTLSAAAAGESVPWSAGMRIFSNATLVGAVSLMPAGVGTMGTAAILALQDLGIGVGRAVAIVSMLRLASTGLTLGVGVLFLAAVLRKTTSAPPPDSVEHFDEIADVYEDQLAPHIRGLLVDRKTEAIQRSLAESGMPMRTGLDLGCGQGAHSAALERRGYRVVGTDPSVRSVARARRDGVAAVAGSALDLPFRDHAFDFVYAIGVLHHIPGEAARRRAFSEIRRVLKPQGLLLIHETNPRNPVFRFYMGYLFPIVRRIDEGTEEWLDPGRPHVPGMASVGTEYATFLPDFAPRPLMPLLIVLERCLERSRWRGYAAHYLAVYRNDAIAADV
jgi:ubiquinone/menaquinone biosynthesis C-methylase UbiE